MGVIHHIWVFSLLTTSMFYFYWKTMVSDPGFVAKAPSIAQAKQVGGAVIGGVTRFAF